MINGGFTTPSPKCKHATSIPERPEKHRKSVWLAQLQGRLEKPQENTSQPVEIEDEKPPRLEGEDDEKGVQEEEEEEKEEEAKKSEQEEETEYLEGAHCRTHWQKMNWPMLWPIWVNMTNLLVHQTSMLKINIRRKMHLNNHMQRR